MRSEQEVRTAIKLLEKENRYWEKDSYQKTVNRKALIFLNWVVGETQNPRGYEELNL